MKTSTFLVFSNFLRSFSSNKNTFLAFIFLMFLSVSFSQENQRNVEKTLFTISSSEEAVKELNNLIVNDKVKLEKILSMIKEIERNNIIVLSSKQYEPIIEKRKLLSTSLPEDKYSEVKNYVESAKAKYVLITDLLK